MTFPFPPEHDLGGKCAAIMLEENGWVGVSFDPKVTQDVPLDRPRTWAQRQVSDGQACRILWPHQLSELTA